MESETPIGKSDDKSNWTKTVNFVVRFILHMRIYLEWGYCHVITDLFNSGTQYEIITKISISGIVYINMKIKCIDCGCYPEWCIASRSTSDCPHCSLDECCCWSVDSIILKIIYYLQSIALLARQDKMNATMLHHIKIISYVTGSIRLYGSVVVICFKPDNTLFIFSINCYFL